MRRQHQAHTTKRSVVAVNTSLLTVARYFHRAQALYVTGERILPGNWGRLIRANGPRHAAFYREYMLEKIRGDEFPDRPSRMDAAFAFVDEEFALDWARTPNIVEYVYAVRLAKPDGVHHLADMSLIDRLNDFRSFEGVESCARKYWRGEVVDPRQVELIVYSELIVEARLTRIPEDG